MYDIVKTLVIWDHEELSQKMGRPIRGEDLVIVRFDAFNGLLWGLVYRQRMGHYCGCLVGDCKLVESCEEQNVHGGWTFSHSGTMSLFDKEMGFVEDPTWKSIGFDCAHFSDWTQFDQTGTYMEAMDVLNELEAVVRGATGIAEE